MTPRCTGQKDTLSKYRPALTDHSERVTVSAGSPARREWPYEWILDRVCIPLLTILTGILLIVLCLNLLGVVGAH